METSVGTRGSDSLLHSLSSGLWAPRFSLECPISFSPFLPFGTLGNTAGDSGVFFIARTDNIRYSQIVIRDSDDGVWKPLKTVFKIFEQKKTPTYGWRAVEYIEQTALYRFIVSNLQPLVL